MASIEVRNGRFRAIVRRKGKEISHTFSTRETAELWGKYKDDLINDMSAFDVPENELITLEQAIDMKLDAMRKVYLDKRSIDDIFNLKELFNDFLKFKLSDITEDIYKDFSEKFMRSIVTRGGNKKNGTGLMKLPSLSTLKTKFRRLSTVYSNLINNGIKLENIPLKILGKL